MFYQAKLDLITQSKYEIYNGKNRHLTATATAASRFGATASERAMRDVNEIGFVMRVD